MDGEEGLEALDGDTWPDIVFLDYTLNVGDSGDEVGKKDCLSAILPLQIEWV
jgi:CheY-like chemotaxis protein